MIYRVPVQEDRLWEESGEKVLVSLDWISCFNLKIPNKTKLKPKQLGTISSSKAENISAGI